MPGMSPGLRSSTFCALGARILNVTRRSGRTSGDVTAGAWAAPRPAGAWTAGAAVDLGTSRATTVGAINKPTSRPPNARSLSRTRSFVMMRIVIDFSRAEAVLLQVRPDDVHEVLSGPTLFRLRSSAVECVITDMPLDHFRHQTVHGTACRGNQAKHIAAFRLRVQGARKGLDLAPNARHAKRQPLLLANRVGHGGQYIAGIRGHL